MSHERAKVQTSSSSLTPSIKTDVPTLLHRLHQGISYLVRLQDPSGVWTDFWLAVGTSTAWVSAYVGESLRGAAAVLNRFDSLDVSMDTSKDLSEHRRRSRLARLARDAAERAGAALLDQLHPRRGWGYNHRSAPDADSTAHALILLARLGAHVPEGAVEFLREHRHASGLYSTYRSPDPANAWARPYPDLTAAALLALDAVGALSQERLLEEWASSLGSCQSSEGVWRGYWWDTPQYTTGMALSVWDAAGRPPLHHPVPSELPAANAFDMAWNVIIQRLATGKSDASEPALERLLGCQEPDGGWPSSPILRVPPSHPTLRSGRTDLCPDARRLFTSATAVRALTLVLENHQSGEPLERSTGIVSAPMSSACSQPVGRSAYAPIVREAASVLGFSRSTAADAEGLFASLTRRSLASPSPWPSRQLSSLSGGVPLEFSAVLAERERVSLRYATEVSAPYLPPRRRAVSGLRVLGTVATELGLVAPWRRIHRGLAAVMAVTAPLPADLRFGVWGGIDQAAPSPHAISTQPKLKVYVNLLHSTDSPGMPRILNGLAAAGIPSHPRTLSALERLNAVGYPQQIGFRVGSMGEWECKVYFELPGWRREAAEGVLDALGWPTECKSLIPEIPSLLRESLARKERSGLSLRIDTRTGAPLEVTSTAAFPRPMKSPEAIRMAILAWAEHEEWACEGYAKLSAYLLRARQHTSSPFERLHTIFTRTLTPSGKYATVYLRPPPPT